MKRKKILSFIAITVSVLMLLAIVPITVSAASGDVFYGNLEGTQFSSENTNFSEYLKYEIITEPAGESSASHGTVRITSRKITTPETHLVIPTAVTFGGKTYDVTEIGLSSENGMDRGVFANAPELVTVSLPDGIICHGATFMNCTNLTAVYGLLGSVNYRMFYECTSLEQVYLSHRLQSIGAQSFRRSGLKEICLPSGIKEIPSMAFLGCSHLESVSILYSTVHSGSSTPLSVADDAFNDIGSLNLYVRDPNSALIDLYGAKKIERLEEDYAYDNFMYQLSASSFVYNGAEQKPTLRLDDYSSALTEGVHYQIVYYTRDGRYTTDLTSVGAIRMLVYGIPSGGYGGYVSSNSDNTEYTITPASLNMRAVDMPLTPGEVYNDTNGSKVIVSSGLQEGDQVTSATLRAHDTKRLGSIYIDDFVIKNANGEDVTANYTFTPGSYGSAIFVVDGIQYRALTNPQQLQIPGVRPGLIPGVGHTLMIPGTAAVVGRATDNEDADIVIPDKVTVDGNTYNVTEISEYAFRYDTTLKSITLSKNIETVGFQAFEDNTALTSVTLNDGLKTIYTYAFAGTALTEISLPDSLVEIALGAFPTGITIYATGDCAAVAEYMASATGTTLKTVVDLSKNVASITADLTDTSFDYDGNEHKPTFASISYGGTALVLGTHYELVYLRGNVETDDMTSAGEITVMARGLESGGYRGSYSLAYTIEGVPVTVIARDMTVADGETVDGTAIDLIYFGLQFGDYIESVKLTANGDRLIPSALVVKNAAGDDVSSSYKVTYVDGRSFTGFEKSIVSVEKTATEGKIDTYTITFSDGSTYDFTIENGTDGQNGSNGSQGVQGVTPMLQINTETNMWEVSYDGGTSWTSLGVKATGEKGDPGDPGAPGTPGTNGVDAIAPQIRINAETNMWEISTDGGNQWTSLGVKATGEKGDPGDPGAPGTPGTNGVDAIAPQIRINAETNMWEISTDGGNQWTSLGVKATGEKGDPGEPRAPGTPGTPGSTGVTPRLRINTTSMLWEVSYDGGDSWESLGVGVSDMDTIQGEDGVTPQLRINLTNNMWEVSYDHGTTWESLNVKATGEDGKDGEDGQDGQDGQDGAPGTNGKDAIAPQLRINSETNMWEISTDGGTQWTSLNVKATGEDGKPGEDGEDGADAIAPQLRVNTESNMWEVSYDNGTTWESLNVTVSDIDTIQGEDGVTPQLRINPTSNMWEVSYDNGTTWTSLEVKATGDKGDTGAAGADGAPGRAGADGSDGTTPELRINPETNMWEISYDEGATWRSLDIQATGSKGDKGDKGDTGATGAPGAPGAPGADGADGADGDAGKDGVDGVTIAAVAMGGLSLASIIALAIYMIIKKKFPFLPA